MRAALYIRVSSQEQAMHGLSLEAQKSDLERFAKSHGMRIVGLWADEGISARKPASKRPALQDLLNEVRSGNVDIILFIKLDRWFRNVKEYYKVQEVLEKHKVDWKCTQEDYETSTASGRLKINIMLSVAQDEADRTSERIKFVFDSRRKSGLAISAKTPLGYVVDENKRVVKDARISAEIDRMFAAFMETSSLVRTYEACPALNLNSNKLTRILHNRAYMGDWNGTPTEPYITEEQFNHIQSMRKQNKYPRTGKVHMFSGIIHCAECGNRYSSHTYKTKKGMKSFYLCHSHYNHYGCGNALTINEENIERYLLDHIDAKVKIEIDRIESADAVDNEPKRKKIRDRLTRLSELYVNELISMDDYKAQYAALQSELESVPADAPKKNVDDLRRLFEGSWQDVYQSLSIESRRALWLTKLERITIDSNRNIDFTLRF